MNRAAPPDDRSGDADREHLQLLREVSYRPVFIIGDHRSGTSLLYSLLDASGCFNVVRAHHIIYYDRILADHLHGTGAATRQGLNDWLAQAGQRDRMIDALPVSADMVEEYGFHISASSQPRLDRHTLAAFDELCRKVQFTGTIDRPLLLKNTWDCVNFSGLRALVPGARFIFVQRDPLRIMSSQIAAVWSLLEDYSPYQALLAQWYRRLHASPLRLAVARWLFSPRRATAYRITRRHVCRAAAYYLAHIDDLDPAESVAVRYEDLCRAPVATLGRIFDFLNLDDRSGSDYRTRVQPRERPLHPRVAADSAVLYRNLADYCARCGFDADGSVTS